MYVSPFFVGGSACAAPPKKEARGEMGMMRSGQVGGEAQNMN